VKGPVARRASARRRTPVIAAARQAQNRRPARSTISQLDDNIRRHHRRFYGFYVAEFSSRVTGAARARIGDPGRASKPARKRAAASTSSGCRSD
jgi:hypothetical protein